MITEVDFEKIYLDHRNLVTNFCRKRTNKIHESDIDDIVQNVFIKVFLKHHLYDSEKSNLGTWLCTIAKNEVKDYFKRAANRRHVIVDMNYDYDDLKMFGFRNRIEERLLAAKTALEEDQEVFDSKSAQLKDALDLLEVKQKLIIERHYVDGIKYDEIARELGLRPPNVRKKARRGIEKVKSLIGV